MQVEAPLSRVAVSAVDLGSQCASIGQFHKGGRAERWPSRGVRGRMARPRPGRLDSVSVHREKQMQTQERARRLAPIAVKRRGSPLVGDREVERAVAVDVGDTDTPADPWLE